MCGSAHDQCKPQEAADVLDWSLDVDLSEGKFSRRVRDSSRAVRKALTSLKSDARLREAYGNGVLVPLSPVLAFAQSFRVRPPLAEEMVWRRFEALNGLSLCPTTKSVCSCRWIGCEGGRISGIVANRIDHTVDFAPLSSLKRLRIMFGMKLANVPWLRVRFRQLQAIFIDGNVEDIDSLRDLPHTVPQLKYLELMLPTNEYDPDVKELAPESLEPLCSLTGLRMLAIIGPFVGLPSCFANLQKLLHLDVRGCWLNQPLPQSLRTWSQLRTFIAFGQREHFCPAKGCLPSVDNGLGDDPDVVFWCPVGGWTVAFESVAFPEWTSIQKFWVDQNFLTGTIPSWLPTQWRQLRTLDLYSNRLSGSIPKELAALPQIFQLQLHDNRLTGSVPSTDVFSPSLRFLHVAMNAELRGCWPARFKLDESINSTRVVMYSASTRVQRTTNCDGSQRRILRRHAHLLQLDHAVEIRAHGNFPWFSS